MYLLDTVVLSEMRKKTRDHHVLAWLESVRQEDLFVSVITIFEIEDGIARKRVTDPAFAAHLAQWFDDVVRSFGNRILPLTTDIAIRWGQFAAKFGHKNLDLAIAATALEHAFTVVTRNVADFAPSGVPVFNPFQAKARGR